MYIIKNDERPGAPLTWAFVILSDNTSFLFPQTFACIIETVHKMGRDTGLPDGCGTAIAPIKDAMSTALDVTVLPIMRRAGRDLASAPGVYIATPPRRTARGRDKDRLVMHLLFEGDEWLGRQQYAELLANLAKSYYQTPGTATSAMRALAERLNVHLLKRNLETTGRERQVIGRLNLVLLRDERLYLAHSGAWHGFLLGGEQFQHFYDPQGAGRGLGASRMTPIRFYQAELKPGTLLVVTPELPGGWNEETLSGEVGLNSTTLARRLLSDAGSDLTALVLEARVGSGEIKLLQLAAAEAPQEEQEEAATPPPRKKERRRTARPARRAPVVGERALEAPGPVSTDASQEQVEVAKEPITPPPSPTQAPPPRAQVTASSPPARQKETAGKAEKARRQLPQIGPVLLDIGERIGTVARSLTSSLGDLLGRMLPGEGLTTIPTSYMALAALVVPLVVVLVAMLVYTRVGRQQQYEQYYAQAAQAAELALGQPDSAEARTAWEATLFFLDRAEEYRQTSESEFLREQARQVLDELDAIERLDFELAITDELDAGVQITRIAVTNTDLYLLDASEGEVLRAWLTGTGYQIDEGFLCGPGPHGSIIVGDIVDIAALPADNEEGADILAIDANGNLLFCFADQKPLSIALEPPDSNWGAPNAITLQDEDLYVLDPVTNAVWVYEGGEAGYRGLPRFFFGERVPTLQEAVDLTVSRENLFLLHADGHLTSCELAVSDEDQVTCTDPAEFSDGRTGREDGTYIEGTSFARLAQTPPPEPSIYLLDPDQQAVYHFSLRLNLVRQYRAAEALPDQPATAFGFGSNRTVFLALGNQVYMAPLP